MSLSDVSDLTDLSSDEDDFPPSKTRTKASKKGSKEYKISGVLRAPRTTSYTAKSLYGKTSGLLAVFIVHYPSCRPNHRQCNWPWPRISTWWVSFWKTRLSFSLCSQHILMKHLVHRCCMARVKAVRSYRLYAAKLLHAPSNIWQVYLPPCRLIHWWGGHN